MRTLLQILAVATLLVLPVQFSAKRVARPSVKPVVSESVEYSADGDGRNGYVVATEVGTGQELWRKKIFPVHIKPWIEGDNQWIFISDLKSWIMNSWSKMKDLAAIG
jgi:hypothetical protein